MRPKNETATVNVLLRKNRINKFGAYPIILKVTKDRKTFIKSLGYDAMEEEWDAEKQRPKTKHPNYLKLKKLIEEKVGEIDDIMLDFSKNKKTFSIEDLNNKFVKKNDQMLVFHFFDFVIKYLNDEGRVGTADTYFTTKRIIELFCNNDTSLQFSEIDYTFLRRLLTFLRIRGNNDRTLFFYFKTFRALINRAIKEGVCRAGDYGFKDFSLSQFDLETQRIAITIEDIQKIEAADILPHSAQWNARNYFLFSFYTRGMNLVDIAKLERKDLVNGRLNYIRAKTGDPFTIKKHEKMLTIIEAYQGLTYKDYLFPVYGVSHVTSRDKKERLKSLSSSINKALKKIAKKCGIESRLVFYVGRHSYANNLQELNIPTDVIKDLLGHDDIMTTKIYLRSFGDNKLDVCDDVLYGKM